MKKRILIISLIMVFINIVFSINIIKADSGFDIDYDSSSNITSNESFDKYSNRSSSDNFLGWLEYAEYGDFIEDHPIIFFIIVILFLIFLVIMFISIIKYVNNKIKEKKLSNLESEDIFKNKKKLEKQIINNFKEIQLLWMKQDEKKLAEYLNDELYNSYIMQLNTLKEKKQKNIIKNLIVTDIEIVSTKKYNNILTIKCYLTSQFRDYIINSDKKIIRGSKFIVYVTKYYLEFILIYNNINKCPNCGAEIKSKKCDYCKAIIPDNNYNLVLSKKEIKDQNQNDITCILIILTTALILFVICIAIFLII